LGAYAPRAAVAFVDKEPAARPDYVRTSNVERSLLGIRTVILMIPDSDSDLPAISSRKWKVLLALRAEPRLSAGELASRLDISEQATSKHLDRLFRYGLTMPDPSWGLRRPRRWKLTASGVEALRLLNALRNAGVGR
jgi:DNA-binding MarR family transcriptional regulator